MGVSLIFWVWCFFFPLLVSLVGLFGGLFFLESSFLLSWDITVNRESNFEMVFLIDSFSLIFLFTVGMVSCFVLIYSNYYMEGSMFKKKFILTMMVFILSMMVLSMSGDLFWIMVGWDGLGFSSMCLIFFFQNWKSFNSSMVTFISNRIGDFLIISFFSFVVLFSGGLFFEGSVTLWFLSFFLCFGAFSKSAQVPFSAWLPLAMAAPTPVSSLVHSSTLVTAGVYMLIRFKSFISKEMFKMVFFVSFLTIILAGMSSIGEYDLKKIIALSTLSHIGLMMMFVGIGSFFCAKIHLVIHAFFKSLLFMVSGFVIHDNNNFQDIRWISVSSKNSFFSMTFLLSVFSMMGVPFFSGFFSKEILLMSIFESMSSFVYVVLFFFSVSVTCSYSVRMIYYFFVPFFPLVPLVSKSSYPMKAFFFMSVVSSFFSSVVVCSLISKEEVVNFSNFSGFQKLMLLISIIVGLFLGGVFSMFFLNFNWSFLKVCHSMWMIHSVNLVYQKTIFDTSAYLMMKGDVKGFLDFLSFFFGKMFGVFSNIFMNGLFLNPFFFLKLGCFLGLGILFF